MKLNCFDQEVVRCGSFIINQVIRGVKPYDAITQAQQSYGTFISQDAMKAIDRNLTKDAMKAIDRNLTNL